MKVKNRKLVTVYHLLASGFFVPVIGEVGYILFSRPENSICFIELIHIEAVLVLLGSVLKVSFEVIFLFSHVR